MIHPDEIRMHVREHYAARAGAGQGCCGDGDVSCCATAPEEAIEGFDGPSLGCGTPLQYAAVRPGETVVDLGSGAGRETLLAAREVGPTGRAVGIDMTPEMIHKARENARRTGIGNAEFRLGEIEHIPLRDGEADVVISNCVINLVPDKLAAFQEAFRILRPGGRLVVSDIVSHGALPRALRETAAAYAACVAGAMDAAEYLATITSAGFVDVETVSAGAAPPGTVFSVTVVARKPAA